MKIFHIYNNCAADRAAEWRLYMKLSQLFAEYEYTLCKGSMDISVEDIIYDSRKMKPGTVFVCLKGATFDAHDYISEVAKQGAVAVVIEDEKEVLEDITVIRVKNTREALAFMSAAFFGHPARKLKMVGITGTKGKTTTSYMIQSILQQAGKKIGIIGTIGALIDGVKQKTKNTTPESYELQRLFAAMVDAGCEYCVMEVSSQGLKQHRVAGFQFDYGLFTNFSADHIGPTEHADMEEYLYCKSLLFRQCRYGILNKDDASWEGVIKDHTCEIMTYGLSEDADFRAKNVDYLKEPGILGIAFDVEGNTYHEKNVKETICLSIPGTFNVYNSMAAFFVCSCLGINHEVCKTALFQTRVRGRVETIDVADHFTIMIDYAHNAASTESLMSTLMEYHPKRIVCVYGCGGNRSKLRRYDMGEICGKYAALSILTCDNPRDESIEEINNDIKVGLARSNGKYIEIEDRTEAIHYSMDHAEDGDVIVLLGKGHEDYQEIKGQKYYYSEREVILEYAEALKKKNNNTF